MTHLFEYYLYFQYYKHYQGMVSAQNTVLAEIEDETKPVETTNIKLKLDTISSGQYDIQAYTKHQIFTEHRESMLINVVSLKNADSVNYGYETAMHYSMTDIYLMV
jgi:hypothetical protein